MTFHEQKSVLNSSGKPVAKVHYESSIKGQYINTLREPIQLPSQFIIAYHGTNNKFDKFNKTKIGSAKMGDLFGKGFYFTSDKEMAQHFGKYVMKVYLDIKNPYIRTQKELMKEMMIFLSGDGTEDDFTESILSGGYDSFIITDRTFGGNMKFPNKYEGFTEYVVFDSDKIRVIK